MWKSLNNQNYVLLMTNETILKISKDKADKFCSLGITIT